MFLLNLGLEMQSIAVADCAQMHPLHAKETGVRQVMQGSDGIVRDFMARQNFFHVSDRDRVHWTLLCHVQLCATSPPIGADLLDHLPHEPFEQRPLRAPDWDGHRLDKMTREVWRCSRGPSSVDLRVRFLEEGSRGQRPVIEHGGLVTSTEQRDDFLRTDALSFFADMEGEGWLPENPPAVDAKLADDVAVAATAAGCPHPLPDYGRIDG